MVPCMPADVPTTHQIEAHLVIGIEKKRSVELSLAMVVFLQDFYAQIHVPVDLSIIGSDVANFFSTSS